MSTGAAVAGPALVRGWSDRLAGWFEREALVVSILALFVVVLLVALPKMLVQDSWLTLVSGREIANHGLPHTDTLTVWGAGKEWVDQQWLAQLSFFGLSRLGGLKLVLLVHALLLAAAFALAVAAARFRGASPKSVALTCATCMLAAPWILQMRAQSFAPLLFVASTWLLISDSRVPRARVLCVLPILVLWANIHGSVMLGVLLAAMRGIQRLLGRYEVGAMRRRLESLALVCSPVLLFASPYTFSLAGYYHGLLANPLITDFLQEWQPSTPSFSTAIFYLIAFVATGLVARNARALTGFEIMALIVLAIGGLWAIRDIPWFTIACMMILPILVDRELPARNTAPRGTLYPSIAAVAFAAVCGSLLLVAFRPASWFERTYPIASLQTVAIQASDSRVRVFADDRHTDWLLWKLPELRGRIAYDVRFEFFSKQQFEKLVSYRNRSGHAWRSAASGYSLVTLDPTQLDVPASAYGTVIYKSSDIIIVRQAEHIGAAAVRS